MSGKRRRRTVTVRPSPLSRGSAAPGGDIALVRLEPRDMAALTIVVHGARSGLLGLRLALWLMRLAGRVGGFQRVVLIREK